MRKVLEGQQVPSRIGSIQLFLLLTVHFVPAISSKRCRSKLWGQSESIRGHPAALPNQQEASEADGILNAAIREPYFYDGL